MTVVLGWSVGVCFNWEHHKIRGNGVLKAHHNISCRDNAAGKGLQSTFQHGTPVLKSKNKVGKEKERESK